MSRKVNCPVCFTSYHCLLSEAWAVLPRKFRNLNWGSWRYDPFNLASREVREMPDLVGVATSYTEADLAAIVELLEAHDVPCFVRDARLPWVTSGVHVCVGRPRTIMVPRTRVAKAAGLIGDLKRSRAAHDGVAHNHLSSRLRALIRSIWFGRCRPVARNFK